jgi:hypothetical protein
LPMAGQRKNSLGVRRLECGMRAGNGCRSYGRREA